MSTARHSMCVALAILWGMPAIALPLTAARGQVAITPQAGDLGIFFDQAGTEASKSGVSAFVPFDLYVLAFDIPGGMQGYEFAVSLPTGMIISSGRRLPEGASDTGAGDDNWIVSTGGACVGASGPFAAVTYAGALFLSAPIPDMHVCLHGATPSRFANGVPGYVGCDPPGTLLPFGAAYVGCAVINPSVIYPCFPPLYFVTIEVGSGEAAAGSAVSLPVLYVPEYSMCISSGATLGHEIAHAELDFTWDPAVATLVGARWGDIPLTAPTINLIVGPGTATAVLDRPDGMCTIYAYTRLLLLDFVAAPRAGQTPVAVTRAALVLDDGTDLEPAAQFSAGSIVVGAVADAVESFGAWKARWIDGQ